MSLIIDFFAQESAGGNLLGFFLGILEQILRACVQDQIFRDLLEHFIPEVVRK